MAGGTVRLARQSKRNPGGQRQRAGQIIGKPPFDPAAELLLGNAHRARIHRQGHGLGAPFRLLVPMGVSAASPGFPQNRLRGIAGESDRRGAHGPAVPVAVQHRQPGLRRPAAKQFAEARLGIAGVIPLVTQGVAPGDGCPALFRPSSTSATAAVSTLSSVKRLPWGKAGSPFA